MDDPDLRAVFEQLSVRGGPPHDLTPDVLVAAARRVRRRQVATAALAGAAVAAIAAVPVLLGVVPSAGRTPGPGTPGVPPASTGSPAPSGQPPGPRASWCHIPNSRPPSYYLCWPLGTSPIPNRANQPGPDPTKKDADEKSHDADLRAR